MPSGGVIRRVGHYCCDAPLTSELGHGPTIGSGPHLDGSTSDSGEGNRAGLTGRRNRLLLAIFRPPGADGRPASRPKAACSVSTPSQSAGANSTRRAWSGRGRPTRAHWASRCPGLAITPRAERLPAGQQPPPPPPNRPPHPTPVADRSWAATARSPTHSCAMVGCALSGWSRMWLTKSICSSTEANCSAEPPRRQALR